MDFYPLYLFDGFRHQDIFPKNLSEVSVVREAMKKLRFQELGVNPRFERLGERLADHADEFPVFDERERETGYFWLNNPKAELARWKYAVWQPEIYDLEKMSEFLKVLFPLARQLGLDIYDGMQDVYLPARGLAVPNKGIVYRVAFDPGLMDKERVGVFSDKIALSHWLRNCLAQVFEQDGFSFLSSSLHENPEDQDNFDFERHIPGGGQKFSCWTFDRLSCSFFMYCDSARLGLIHKDIFPEREEERGGMSTAVSITFDKLLKCLQPAWKKLEDPEWAAYEEEAAWRIAEFKRYALPVFDRLKTVGGVDWWYNESNLPWEVRRVDAKSIPYSYIESAVIYAYLSGNPKANALADDFERFVNETSSFGEDPGIETYPVLREMFAFNTGLSYYDWQWAKKDYPILLNYCRSGRLKPVGRDEPA